MIYAIKANECLYYGLHGIEDRFVIECDRGKEAEEAAIAASIDVINSYGCVLDALENYALDKFSGEFESDNTDNYYGLLEEIIHKDINYEIYVLDPSIDISIDELNKMAYDNWDELITKYRMRIE